MSSITDHSLAADSSRSRQIASLRKAIPFEHLPEDMLNKIADIATIEHVSKGATIYRSGEVADDLYVIISGQVEHALGPSSEASVLVKVVSAGGIIGWAAVLKNRTRRLAKTTALEDTELLKISGMQLMDVLSSDLEAAKEALERCAQMMIKDFTIPPWLARVQDLPSTSASGQPAESHLGGWSLFAYRFSKWLKSPRPYFMLIGFVLFFGGWYLLSEYFHIWRFDKLPGPWEVLQEWFSRNPMYGLSVFTPDYYMHIWVSTRRVFFGFVLATVLGVPVGLFLGWSKKFREFIFPLFETLRPIPVLAWVPLAILMFSGEETPVIFLTTLASFYATALNTMLGVESIDDSYPRAAACLGASRWQIFRHVVIPGSLPFIFTGLQISIGVAWFSLVAGEMVTGEFGLGYVIMNSFTTIRYPTIVIGMLTLGIVGYITSAMVRMVGDYLMQWRVRELAMGGQ